MAWLQLSGSSEPFKARFPVAVDASTLASSGNKDVSITVPKTLERFWTSLGSDGFDLRVTDADGFTLGKNNSVNDNGVTYHWIAFEATPGELVVGTYLGTSADNRDITGIGITGLLDLGKIQLQAQTLPIREIGKWREVLELLEAEVVQKGLGGTEQLRTARHIAMPHDPNPLPLH